MRLPHRYLTKQIPPRNDGEEKATTEEEKIIAARESPAEPKGAADQGYNRKFEA